MWRKRNPNAYFQMDYVMSFLMGLNDSFAQIRGQLLLLDPIPPISKVFSLISQEERHKNVSSQTSSNVVNPLNNMELVVRSDGAKKIGPNTSNSGNNRGRRRIELSARIVISMAIP